MTQDLEIFDSLRELSVSTAVRKKIGYLVGYQLANVGDFFAPNIEQGLLAFGQPLLVADLVYPLSGDLHFDGLGGECLSKA